MPLPNEDAIESRSRFHDMLAFYLGGRSAEEIVFGTITTGASNDLEQVTKLARTMVTSLGMSDKLGPLTFGQRDELVFLGREISEQRNYSDEIAHEIDMEVRRLVNEAHKRARQVIIDHRDKLEALAQLLLEIETVDTDKFRQIMKGPEAETTPTAV
jgi:cell division protease FtsH